MMHDGAVVVHCGVVPTWWLPPTHLAGVALARNLCEIPKRQWGTSAPSMIPFMHTWPPS